MMNPISRLIALILSLALLLTLCPAALAENSEAALWQAQQRQFGAYSDETDDGVLFPVRVTSGGHHLAIILRLEDYMNVKAAVWLDQGGEYVFLNEFTVCERGSRYPIKFYSGESSGIILSHHGYEGVNVWGMDQNGSLQRMLVGPSKAWYPEYSLQSADEEAQFQSRFGNPTPWLTFSTDSFLSASISKSLLQSCFMMKMDLASINGGY